MSDAAVDDHAQRFVCFERFNMKREMRRNEQPENPTVDGRRFRLA